jgi:NarL family two-component system response regulator LiaR
MAQQLIRVLVVDDHYITRKGILGLLHDVEGIEVVGEAENGREGIDKTRALAPDVVLMDLVMPEMGGVAAIRQILAHRPATAILILSGCKLQGEALVAVRAGALGYLTKTASQEELCEAIRRVHRGEPALPSALNRKLLGHVMPNSRMVATEALTQRELEVLGLVARGLENHDISEKLLVSEATVRTHLHNMLSKLGLSNRVELVLYALGQGWASLDQCLETVSG